MWYKNIAGRFFGLVTKHACDRQTRETDRPTDRITSVRPIREFREMPITDISMWMHPITDTDMKVTAWQ